MFSAKDRGLFFVLFTADNLIDVSAMQNRGLLGKYILKKTFVIAEDMFRSNTLNKSYRRQNLCTLYKKLQYRLIKKWKMQNTALYYLAAVCWVINSTDYTSRRTWHGVSESGFDSKIHPCHQVKAE